MNSNRSICFVSPYAFPLLVPNGKGPGGAERQLFLFGKGLADLGWRVSFITDHPNAEDRQEETVLPVYPCSFSYLGGSNLRIPIDWLSLLTAMKKANSQYYVLKVPGHLLAPMATFCRLFKRYLVFWSQMNYDANPNIRNASLLVGMLHDFGIKNTDIVIAQTTEQKDNFKKNYGIEASLIPSICSNLSTDEEAESAEKQSVQGKQLDVLWVGNSMPKKRYEVILELAKLLPHVQFTIAMNLADSNRYREAEKECQLLENINFLGMVAPTQMERIFSQAKVFLNTSTQEGFPNTYLQSWMNGVPTVSLNIDPDNIIKKQTLGLVIGDKSLSTSYDYHSLAAMLVSPIKKLLMEPALRNIMGKNAKQYVFLKHDALVVTKQFERVLLNHKMTTS